MSAGIWILPVYADPAVARLAAEIAERHEVESWRLRRTDWRDKRVAAARDAFAYELGAEVGLDQKRIAQTLSVCRMSVGRMLRRHRSRTGLPPIKISNGVCTAVDTGEPWPELIEVARSGARAIIRAVAERYDVPAADIVGRNRRERTVFARQAAAWWLLRLTRFSTSQVGRFLGDRDHTTVMHAERAHMARHGLPRARENVWTKRRAA